jgi:hypothetical protein
MLILLRSAGSGKTKKWKCALYTVEEGVIFLEKYVPPNQE